MQRNSDFLSDRDYDAMASTRVDRELFQIGAVALMLTTVLSLGFLAL